MPVKSQHALNHVQVQVLFMLQRTKRLLDRQACPPMPTSSRVTKKTCSTSGAWLICRHACPHPQYLG